MIIIGVDYHPSFQQIGFMDPVSRLSGSLKLGAPRNLRAVHHSALQMQLIRASHIQ